MQGRAQLLASILHVVPFGTAADVCASGFETSGVGVGELILVTVGDAALVGGWVLSTPIKGGKALVGGTAGIKLARGAALLDAGTNAVQTGIAVKNAVDDPTASNIAVAGAIGTAIIFGVTWKLTKRKVAPKRFPFEEKGISYSSTVEKGIDGETVIEHFITQNGKKKPIGISTISKEGVLSNAFDVPEELQGLGISGRAYAESACQGFKSLQTSFNAGPKSVNFNEFVKVYDPAKKNAVEALLQTPAGKVASRDYGLKPDPASIDITKTNVSANWIKE